MAHKRLNFKVVEISESDMDYEQYYDEFKEDFLNPHYSIDKLMDKYPIPKFIYKRWSRKIKEEYGLLRKPTHVHSVNKNDLGMLNITRLTHCFSISKSIQGVTEYFGKYPDLETAQKVRDILYESDWDASLLPDLIKKYGWTKEKKIHKEAMDHYEEFKKLYVANPPVKYVDIIKILGVSPAIYSVLVKEFRKEHPYLKKTRFHEYSDDDSDEQVGKVKQRRLRYITAQNYGGFTVNKHINGVHRSFGTFKSVEDAIRRRDDLERNDWHD